MSLFLFTKNDRGDYVITHNPPHNDVTFGELSRDHDLCFNWWPPKDCGSGGFWSSEMLKAIADKLEELNKPIMDDYLQWCEKHETAQQLSDIYINESSN